MGGDAATLTRPPATDHDEFAAVPNLDDDSSPGPDSGSDFAYPDRDGRRTAVELKLRSRDPPPSSVRNWLEHLRRIVANSPNRFERAELWVLSSNASTLTIWAGHDAPGTTYGLADVISTESPQVSDRKSRTAINSAYIQSRVETWRAQVQALFTLVTTWTAEGGYATNQTSTVQMDEELMQRFGVDPVQLPVLKIEKVGVIVATARPVGLWIIGANGRVDFLTAKAHAMIVNNSRDPSLPDWQAYLSRSEAPQPFDKNFLLNFLHANEGT